MNKKHFLFLILLTLSSSCIYYYLNQNSKSNVEKPNGLSETKIPFEEISLAESQIKILKPRSWTVYKERSRNGFNYYITPYKYEDLNKFKRGLSISVIENVSTTEKLTPNDLALFYINNTKQLNQDVNVKKLEIKGLQGYQFQLQENKGLKNSLITSIIFVADDKNDVFYNFLFQYERSKWNETYPIRNLIFKNIKFAN